MESNPVGFINVLDACRQYEADHLVYASSSLFARNILASQPIKVFNHGRHSRDFTYIDDIVEGVIRTLDRPARPDPGFAPVHPDAATSDARTWSTTSATATQSNWAIS